MKSKSDAVFVKILETDSLTDITSIRSVLDDQAVQYFIQGENMKFINPYDHAILMVAREDVEKAVELLKPLRLNYVWMTFGENSYENK